MGRVGLLLGEVYIVITPKGHAIFQETGDTKEYIETLIARGTKERDITLYKAFKTQFEVSLKVVSVSIGGE